MKSLKRFNYLDWNLKFMSSFGEKAKRQLQKKNNNSQITAESIAIRKSDGCGKS